MSQAEFTISGAEVTDGDAGYDASLGETILLTLKANPSPALSVLYEVFDAADPSSPLASADAPALTFTGSGTASERLANPNAEASLALPGSGIHSYIVRCTTSHPTGPETFERMVVLRGVISGLRKTVPGETTQYRARGYSDEFNAMVDEIEAGGGGGGSVAARATFTNTDLAAGIYTFNHGLGVTGVDVTITNNSGKRIVPDDITDSGVDDVLIDLGAYAPITGTWIATARP